MHIHMSVFNFESCENKDSNTKQENSSFDVRIHVYIHNWDLHENADKHICNKKLVSVLCAFACVSKLKSSENVHIHLTWKWFLSRMCLCYLSK